MGWMASDDQPPVSDSVEGVTSYPPPSAAATPSALGEAKAPGPTGARSPAAYPSTSYPPLSQTASAPSSAPAAAAIPRSGATAATSTPASGVAPASATAGATPTVGGSFAPGQNNLATAPRARPAAAELPIGLPPGVTAPQVPTHQTTPSIDNYSADVQRGAYPVTENSPNAPSQSPSASSQSVAATPQNNHPSPNSGSATTWDNPSSGGNFAVNPTPDSQPATPTTASDFEPSGSGTGVQPIASVAPDTGAAATATHTATASHYESLAAEHASHDQVGPWRPGSTTSYEPSVAGANSGPEFGQAAPPTSTATLPTHGSATRNSGFE